MRGCDLVILFSKKILFSEFHLIRSWIFFVFLILFRTKKNSWTTIYQANIRTIRSSISVRINSATTTKNENCHRFSINEEKKTCQRKKNHLILHTHTRRVMCFSFHFCCWNSTLHEKNILHWWLWWWWWWWEANQFSIRPKKKNPYIILSIQNRTSTSLLFFFPPISNKMIIMENDEKLCRVGSFFLL